MPFPDRRPKMNLLSRMKRLGVVMVGAALIAAACSSSDDSDTGAEAEAGEQTISINAADDDTTTSGDDAAFSFAISRVDRGTKPDIALDADGSPLIAYMLERMGNQGWVKVAKADGSNVQQVHTGYVYGPLDLELAPDGRVVVAYHDHDNEDGAMACQTSESSPRAHPGSSPHRRLSRRRLQPFPADLPDPCACSPSPRAIRSAGSAPSSSTPADSLIRRHLRSTSPRRAARTVAATTRATFHSWRRMHDRRSPASCRGPRWPQGVLCRRHCNAGAPYCSRSGPASLAAPGGF